MSAVFKHFAEKRRYFLFSFYITTLKDTSYGSLAFAHVGSSFPSELFIENLLKVHAPATESFSILNIYEFKDKADFTAYKGGE